LVATNSAFNAKTTFDYNTLSNLLSDGTISTLMNGDLANVVNLVPQALKNSTTTTNLFLNGTFEFDSYMRQESDLTPGELRLYETDFPLVLPKFTHIRFMITADDVIHS